MNSIEAGSSEQRSYFLLEGVIEGKHERTFYRKLIPECCFIFIKKKKKRVLMWIAHVQTAGIILYGYFLT